MSRSDGFKVFKLQILRHFWTLDILFSTLDILPSALDSRHSALDLDILPSTLDPRQKPTLRGVTWRSELSDMFQIVFKMLPSYEWYYTN